MSALQWALLVLGAVAVIAIYVMSRGEKRLPKEWSPTGSTPRPGTAKVPAADQMEMFNGGAGQFDEFGVGKPRRRNEPGIGEAEPALASAVRVDPTLDVPAKTVEEKIVTLLIAARQNIDAQRLHQVLGEQRLMFGDRKIYHRLDHGQTVFSVASLIKPGTLDPAEAESLATPGLTLFMVLPGPTRPRLALQDMIATTRALAERLGAEVYDASRQPFDNDAQRVLANELDLWAKRNGLS